MKNGCNSGTIHTTKLGDPLKSSESHQEQDIYVFTKFDMQVLHANTLFVIVKNISQ